MSVDTLAARLLPSSSSGGGATVLLDNGGFSHGQLAPQRAIPNEPWTGDDVAVLHLEVEGPPAGDDSEPDVAEGPNERDKLDEVAAAEAEELHEVGGVNVRNKLVDPCARRHCAGDQATPPKREITYA